MCMKNDSKCTAWLSRAAAVAQAMLARQKNPKMEATDIAYFLY